jgi:hypothetical protein
MSNMSGVEENLAPSKAYPASASVRDQADLLDLSIATSSNQQVELATSYWELSEMAPLNEASRVSNPVATCSQKLSS